MARSLSAFRCCAGSVPLQAAGDRGFIPVVEEGVFFFFFFLAGPVFFSMACSSFFSIDEGVIDVAGWLMTPVVPVAWPGGAVTGAGAVSPGRDRTGPVNDGRVTGAAGGLAGDLPGCIDW